MKFATAQHEGRRQVFCVDAEARLAWPVSGLLPSSEIGDGSAMLSVIAALPPGSQPLRPIGLGIGLDKLILEAPIHDPPRNLFCVGKNYYEHAREFARSGFDSSAGQATDPIPAAPIIFTKAANTLIGPGATIPLHDGLDAQVDYEAELAVVIGAGGRGIRKEDAWRHVWGYTIVNDVTARDLQARHKQWFLGKSLDGFCPMGPWIVTADELDATDLALACRVNGDLRQSACTRDLIFDIPTLIETISAGITLEPGDVICTGTPAGVGIGFTPPRFLAEGDVVEIEIEGIGRICNMVSRHAQTRSARAPSRQCVTVRDRAARATPAAKGRVVTERCGQGPAVLLVHGLGGTSNSWLPQTMALRERFTVLTPDLLGAGRTAGAAAVSIAAHVSALAATLDEQGIRRAHLVGHSMGSLICQHFAAAYPDRVASLSLVGPIHEPPETARKALRERAAKARADGMAGIADAIVAAGTSADTRRHLPTATAFVRESLMRQDPDGYAGNCEALADARAVDATSIRCPVMLMTGDEDKTAPVDSMQTLASRLSSPHIHVLPGCGHWATVERPRQVNALLLEFLGRHAEA